MKTINVEDIMSEIRNEIKEKGYLPSDLSFNDIPNDFDERDYTVKFSTEELESCRYLANTCVGVNYYQPLGGGLKGLIKKVIRKIIKPIVYPMCQSQELFNSNAVRTINQLTEYVKYLEERLNEKK